MTHMNLVLTVMTPITMVLHLNAAGSWLTAALLMMNVVAIIGELGRWGEGGVRRSFVWTVADGLVLLCACACLLLNYSSSSSDSSLAGRLGEISISMVCVHYSCHPTWSGPGLSKAIGIGLTCTAAYRAIRTFLTSRWLHSDPVSRSGVRPDRCACVSIDCIWAISQCSPRLLHYVNSEFLLLKHRAHCLQLDIVAMTQMQTDPEDLGHPQSTRRKRTPFRLLTTIINKDAHKWTRLRWHHDRGDHRNEDHRNEDHRSGDYRSGDYRSGYRDGNNRDGYGIREEGTSHREHHRPGQVSLQTSCMGKASVFGRAAALGKAAVRGRTPEHADYVQTCSSEGSAGPTGVRRQDGRYEQKRVSILASNGSTTTTAAPPNENEEELRMGSKLVTPKRHCRLASHRQFTSGATLLSVMKQCLQRHATSFTGGARMRIELSADQEVHAQVIALIPNIKEYLHLISKVRGKITLAE
ncbi:putative transmembrane protein [Gregarina niphandrodes]|uniref:Transmembrane protein n=1 Tax=Gregarina niphandrodes TaxID=110365 RepID=A0A023B750_GRENI|nr:putative transmembrane protein [Gregarina niphandrodes]EZG66953.1 putative transmembrane protein [Gregarina niphandrodes]|eukprot:XP_011130412.1 putative transmembrane protein [Gregarina niphandrodes]